MPKNRVFVIGLDAADKDLIDQWASEGLLPNFNELLKTALQGDVENPRGLEAGSCWPTFYFGLRPGETGQFDGARKFDSVKYDHVPFRPEKDLHPPIWTTLSNAGKLCGVIDAPYNYPVNSINGMKVVDRGAHVPAGCGDFMELRTHPPGLAQEIVEKFGPDPAGGHSSDFFPMETPEQVNHFRDIYTRRIANKASLVLHFWNQQRWDYFLSVFTEAHCAGHRCWHIHDPAYPGHDAALASAVGDPLRDIYIELDRAVGRIVDAVRDDARVIVYLSHGMGPRHSGTRLLDRVLARLDNHEVAARTGVAMDIARAVWRRIPEALRKPLMPLRNNITHDSFQPNREGRRYFEVFVNDRTAGVRINLAGREAKGIVSPEDYDAVCEELYNEIHALRNGETNEPLVKEVLRVRDHYRGSHLDNLPDLLVTWNRSSAINLATSDRIGTVDTKGIVTPRTGDHKTTGRFFAVAPDWPHRKLFEKVRAEDFAPTIAQILGVYLERTDGYPINCLTTPPPTSPVWAVQEARKQESRRQDARDRLAESRI